VTPVRRVARGARARLVRLRRRVGPRALVLMYHRVATLEADPQLLAVSPEHFAEHLDAIRRQLRPMGLPDLLLALERGRLPRGAVVLTFDDGYADNLAHARPLLARHGVPATFFVTTAHLGTDREFWWDELERLLLAAPRLPGRLRLRVDGATREWDLGEAQVYDAAARWRDRGWHVERDTDPGPRHRAYRALYDLLHPLPDAERRPVLDELAAWAGAGAAGRPSHRALSAGEVGRLEEPGLLEVGAHTEHHPALAALPLATQRAEIRVSQRRLEEILGHPVRSFAYPHGSLTAETVALVRQAGFRGACSSRPALVRPGTDPLELPRVVMRGGDGDAFLRAVREWGAA
jgi:peptidoglycan/xylan/chitin deacetylase (PgdA/CDA1 family)